MCKYQELCHKSWSSSECQQVRWSVSCRNTSARGSQTLNSILKIWQGQSPTILHLQVLQAVQNTFKHKGRAQGQDGECNSHNRRIRRRSFLTDHIDWGAECMFCNVKICEATKVLKLYPYLTSQFSRNFWWTSSECSSWIASSIDCNFL